MLLFAVWPLFGLLGWWLSGCASAAGGACQRSPPGASGDRSPVDDNFQILIDGNPSAYLPGQQYNLSLSCANGLKFVSFTLLVEAEPGGTAAPPGADTLGRFEIIDDAETKFSTSCENMIESTNTNPKSRVDVAWLAPAHPDGGCVLFKAAVLQHRNVWFIDDGLLTKRLCAEEIDDINSQTPPVNPCCACDEAKYEIVLERKWTRNTHMKDFPAAAWRTRLGEVVGASHTFDYRFWEYGALASRGLQQLAEHGATAALEAEIKANVNSGSIRTIIRAPGIAYRHNVAGSTLATARLDAAHHVVSLVSKIDPSPDWIVGVAGLELCLANCTWIERKRLNLYPWDVGTDAGPSYMSPDQPQVPPDVVRRISSTFPSDYRSPFFDESGAPLRPLATLHVTRKKVYGRDCDFVEQVPMECATHPWNSWSECSSRCGPGSQERRRSYKDAKLAASFSCNVVLRQSQACVGTQCGLTTAETEPEPELEEEDTAPEMRGGGRVPEPPAAECELTAWSAWSECSRKCGRGYRTRTRDYVHPYARRNCQGGLPVELEQREPCEGDDCGGSISAAYDSDEDLYGPPFGVGDTGRGYEEEDAYAAGHFRPPSSRKHQAPQSFGRGRQFGQATRAESDLDLESGAVPGAELGAGSPYGAYDSNGNEGDFEPQENIFGSERLVGERRRGFFGGEDERPEAGPTYGDGLHTFPPNQRSNVRSQVSQSQSQSQSLNTRSNRRPYDEPQDRYGAGGESRSPAIARSSTRPPYSPYPPTRRVSHRPFGEDSAAGVYGVAQQYCLERPTAPPEPCQRRHVVVRNFWFYDAEDHECKLFTSDNCDQTRNRFRSLEACEGACRRPQRGRPEGDRPGGYGRSQSPAKFGWSGVR